ncbi:MAG: hypothetical protein HYX75_05965 [Acidobacteria bacterium]|nr:hypothetical protein [Acidobacteriota bacterium]
MMRGVCVPVRETQPAAPGTRDGGVPSRLPSWALPSALIVAGLVVSSPDAAHAENTEFMLGVSYFGALGPGVDIEDDIPTLARSHHFNHLWVWGLWMEPSLDTASVFDKKGRIRDEVAARLDKLIGLAGAEDMTLTLSFDPDEHRRMWGGRKPKFKTYLNGLRAIAAWLRQNDNYSKYRNVMLNVCTECVTTWDRGSAAGYTTKLMSHYSDRSIREDPAAAVIELFDAVNGLGGDPIPAFISLAFNDDEKYIDMATSFYRRLQPATGRLIAAPHFERSCEDWYAKTESRIRSFCEKLGVDAEIYLQEENRRHNKILGHECDIQTSHFLEAACQARRAGSIGWVFQTQAGFGKTSSFFDGLDQIESQTVDQLEDHVARCGDGSGS